MARNLSQKQCNLNALNLKSTKAKNIRKDSFGLEITLKLKRLGNIYLNSDKEKLYYFIKAFFVKKEI
ncbi:hypothetical protein [Campylobacter volucris]|uniref:hypothetical protein n=1 Tax=Campylobacter volucris TaxID=1031542 RepID=UPI00189CCF7A|nr:hypothetical protein [Campylobacter volucris]MBF7044906.1 hypothetical protein [Campylobacter volucris]